MVGELVTIQSDILNASVPRENDIVISMFAYHHVPDQSKRKYIEVAKSALKRGGILILGEIYSPDRETTLKYYDDLWNAIDPRVQTPALQTFLKQTAESEDFEYKVSKQFAHDQLVAAGFKLLISKKIWPDTLDNVGTYVEVWKLE
jgi:cyclopropane fatty-acyl-phospholipid synthase-like methyltransferase